MKPNATLVWKGRKLMCGSVAVVELWFSTADCKWRAICGTEVSAASAFYTAEKARRFANRRFKLPPDYGAAK